MLDISETSSMRPLLEVWLAFRRSGELAAAPLQHLKSRHTALFEEFTAEEHPADEAFIKEINSERPSARAQARELWLQTEPLWALHPEFISALKAAKG